MAEKGPDKEHTTNIFVGGGLWEGASAQRLEAQIEAIASLDLLSSDFFLPAQSFEEARKVGLSLAMLLEKHIPNGPQPHLTRMWKVASALFLWGV